MTRLRWYTRTIVKIDPYDGTKYGGVERVLQYLDFTQKEMLITPPVLEWVDVPEEYEDGLLVKDKP